MFIEKLSSNKSMIKSIKDFSESNGIIFAECGGYMYLVKDFVNSENKIFPMCNILEGTGKMTNRLQSFGYKEISLDKTCILGNKDTKIKGHEFHWSTIDFEQSNDSFLLSRRIREEVWHNTGQIYKNVFASYIHLHFLSNTDIVKNMKKFILSAK
jgi:cobyrinic acid a,c-diamide synthase